MTCIFAIFGPKSVKLPIYFARDRLRSLLGGGREQNKHFCVRAFGEVS